MPQPRRAPAPAPAPSATSPGAPAAAATVTPLAPAAAVAAGPAAASLAAVAASAAAAQALSAAKSAAVPSRNQIAAAVAALMEGITALFTQRRATFADYVRQTAVAQMPGAPVDRVEALAAAEVNREVEFQRKAMLRLQTALPRALANPDPTARAAEVAQILETEKRYLRQREQAAAQRVVAALEMDLLKVSSPEGAYWLLSPLVREHCVDCLAMANQFWPWEVLNMPGVHLPMHPNCGCRLLGLDEAVRQGLMSPDQIPATEDAVRRATALIGETRRLRETLAPEELEAVITELEDRRLQEASVRDLLRWGKGMQHGGQFKPKTGGDPGKQLAMDLDKLHALVKSESPAQRMKASRGRQIKLNGRDQFVPEASHWSQHEHGIHYQSPPGGTNIYRDGVLISGEHKDLGGPGVLKPGVPASRQWHEGGETAVNPHLPVLGIPDYTGAHLTLGKGAGGSTGAKWAFDEHGDRWLLKTYGGDQDRVATELLSNAIYREMGANVAEAGTLKTPDGGLALTYQTLPGEALRIDKPSAELGRHYMTDALLANWDFVGLTDDNVLWGENGPLRVDQGGTLQFRAQGKPKPFGPVPTEVWTLNGPRGQGFGKVSVSEGQMRSQAQKIHDTLTPPRIDTLVNQAPFADDTMREEVRQALKDRVQWMGAFANGDESLPQPVEGPSARQAMVAAQDQLDPTPEQHEALSGFATNGKLRDDVQGALRKGVPKAHVSDEVASTVSGMDELLRHSYTPDDMVVYRGFDPESYGDPEQLPGRTLREDGYLSATTDLQTARQAPAMIAITVPSGSRAVLPDAVEGISEDAADTGSEDYDSRGIVLARGQRIRVTGVDQIGGRTQIQGVLV